MVDNDGRPCARVDWTPPSGGPRPRPHPRRSRPPAHPPPRLPPPHWSMLWQTVVAPHTSPRPPPPSTHAPLVEVATKTGCLRPPSLAATRPICHRCGKQLLPPLARPLQRSPPPPQRRATARLGRPDGSAGRARVQAVLSGTLRARSVLRPRKLTGGPLTGLRRRANHACRRPPSRAKDAGTRVKLCFKIKQTSDFDPPLAKNQFGGKIRLFINAVCFQTAFV